MIGIVPIIISALVLEKGLCKAHGLNWVILLILHILFKVKITAYLPWNIIQMRIMTIFIKRINVGLRTKYIFDTKSKIVSLEAGLNGMNI